VAIERVRVVDSHTEGEPTRIVLAGGPDLGSGPLRDRVERFRTQHDGFRRAVVEEPRGSNFLVGGLLVPPEDPASTAAVIFFDEATYLGMCGHGTIGLVATLAHVGSIRPGPHRVETPVGVVRTVLHESGRVSVENVVSYRSQHRVSVDVPTIGTVEGDVAWGGNWFFLAAQPSLELRREHVARLTTRALAIRAALGRSGIVGEGEVPIEHVALSGPPADPRNSARHFVLCPGSSYDRSPCGTGTSATMAARFADGTLAEGDVWRQEGILGTVFEGSVRREGRGIRPTISGTAFVTSEADLVIDELDPFGRGIPPESRSRTES
jgi:4-hydroxyproline epimerase